MIGDATARMAQRRLTNAAHQARYRAEQDRRSAGFDFEQFCRAQRARITATLKAQTARIAKAKWGDCEGDQAVFVVSRK